MNRCGNFSRASLISTKSNTAFALCVTALQPYHALTFCVKFSVMGPSFLGFCFKVDIEAIFLIRRAGGIRAGWLDACLQSVFLPKMLGTSDYIFTWR